MYYLLVAIVGLCLTVGARSSSQLAFTVVSGKNDNFFIRNNVTAAQLVLTSPDSIESGPRRLVVALPAGNSGALTHFLPLTTNNSLTVRLVNGSYQSVTEEDNNAGIQADLMLDNNATLGVTIVGAIRTVRGRVWLVPQTSVY